MIYSSRVKHLRLFITPILAIALLGGAPHYAIGDTSISADKATSDARYRSATIQGINIAYREAGDPSNPAIVLLHGFPTSSHMFRELIPKLAKRYHVIAPDYAG